MQGHNQEPSTDLGDNFVEMQDLGDVNQFTLGELEVATNNFSIENFVANGYYATVFRGLLEDGTVVAIKKFNDINNFRGMDAFQREVEHIYRTRHQHILQLLGICATTTQRFLIYPYMSNGSLASRLAVACDLLQLWLQLQVKTCFQERNFGELLDPDLKPSYDQQELEKIADLALSCIEKLPTSRPKMINIVEVLSEMID
ncbi:hypothetical protein FH972_026335 [Carpinus fangiana]|uniref:non-specific serine/threonine protein kinase n=1 Tax=Carpinus fangiana TaxID=176857 RepID=A0A5N6L3Q5_9ROSI|nr:hypothetical protein FH972_026335 [Carpinus fangiana]